MFFFLVSLSPESESEPQRRQAGEGRGCESVHAFHPKEA